MPDATREFDPTIEYDDPAERECVRQQKHDLADWAGDDQRGVWDA